MLNGQNTLKSFDKTTILTHVDILWNTNIFVFRKKRKGILVIFYVFGWNWYKWHQTQNWINGIKYKSFNEMMDFEEKINSILMTSTYIILNIFSIFYYSSYFLLYYKFTTILRASLMYASLKEGSLRNILTLK